jgi:hypothetical protein
MHVYLYVCVRARGWASSPCFRMHARTCSCIYQHLKARPTAAPDFGCERTRPRDNAQTACIHASTRALRYMKEPAHPVNSLGVLRGLRPRFPHLGQLLRRSPVPRVPRAQVSERASGCTRTARRLPAFLRGRTEAAPGLSTDENRRGSRLHAAHAAPVARFAACRMYPMCGRLSAQADRARRGSLTQTRPSHSRPHRRQAAPRSQRYSPSSPRCAMRSSCRAPNDAMPLYVCRPASNGDTYRSLDGMFTEARSCMRSAHAFASPLPAAWCSAVSPWVLAQTTQPVRRKGDGIPERVDATGRAASSDWWMGWVDGWTVGDEGVTHPGDRSLRHDRRAAARKSIRSSRAYTRPHMRIGTGRALICARSRFWAA